METKIFKDPCEQDIMIAADIIKSGGTVAFPTETVYGLGADALDASAAKKIYAAKGRPSDNPLIIHLASPDDVSKYCEKNELFDILASAFMPGPLTVILPKKEIIPYEVTGGLESVAVRVPSDRIANKLIKYSGVPIAAPSANLSGKPSPTCPEHVIADLNGRIDAILCGGRCMIGLESTIVRPESDGSLSVLRPGGITIEMLGALLPDTEINDISFSKPEEGKAPPAPGMKYRHYAPNAKVTILSGEREKVLSFMKEKKNDTDVGFICKKEWSGLLGENALTYSDGMNGMAHELFAILRRFDEMKQIKYIYANMPEEIGIGRAVFNRLIKAAGFDLREID